jgi:hypothetical protein
MWKSLLVALVSVPLAIVLGTAFWVVQGWRAGILAGCSTLAACLVAATLMALFLRRFTLFDVFLPLIFSVIWSAILAPFSLGSDLFTAPAAIGSGLLLTLCLWQVYHRRGEGRIGLIFPLLVYIYEMLPVNIPGPIDDYFALSSDLVAVILYQWISAHPRHLSSPELRPTNSR